MHSKMTQTRCVAIAPWRFRTELLPRLNFSICKAYTYPFFLYNRNTEEINVWVWWRKAPAHCGNFRSFQNERDRGLWREFSLGQTNCNFCKWKIAMYVDSTLSFQEKLLQFYVRIIYISTDSPQKVQFGLLTEKSVDSTSCLVTGT